MSQLKKPYLLKNGEVRIFFVGNPPTKSTEPALLLAPNLENFKCIPGERYDKDQIAAISAALEEVGNLRNEQKPKIEIFSKYDGFNDEPRIFTKVLLPETFVRKISHTLVQPSISIRGTYIVPTKQYNLDGQKSQSAQFVDNQAIPDAIVMGQASQNIRISSGGPLLSWTPVSDPLEQFSIEGIKIKEQATYETFNGIQKMGELYKSKGLSQAQLNYSVYLEWKEFGVDLEEFERSNLAKLFKDKPFADCVIVASNDQEFKCHRNILAINSDALHAMLESGMEESQTQKILMPDVTVEAVQLLLEFMYAKELDLLDKTEEVVLNLLKAADKYNVGQLEKIIGQFLACQPDEWFTIDGALQFYFLTVNVESFWNITEKFRSLMRDNHQQLLECSTYQDWMRREPIMASHFAKMLESERVIVKNEERDAVQAGQSIMFACLPALTFTFYENGV